MAGASPVAKRTRRVEGLLTQFLSKEEAPRKEGIVKETWRSTFVEGMPMMVDHGKLLIKSPVGRGVRASENSDWAVVAGELDLSTLEGQLTSELIDKKELTHFSVAVRQQDPKEGPANIYDRKVVEFSLTSADRAVEPGARIIVCHSHTGEETKVPVYVYSGALVAGEPQQAQAANGSSATAAATTSPAAPPQGQQQAAGATLETVAATSTQQKQLAGATQAIVPPASQATATAAAVATPTVPQQADMSSSAQQNAPAAPAGQASGNAGAAQAGAETQIKNNTTLPAAEAKTAAPKPSIDLSGIKTGKRAAPEAEQTKKQPEPPADAGEEEAAAEETEPIQPPAKTAPAKKAEDKKTVQPPQAKRQATETPKKNAPAVEQKPKAEEAPQEDVDMEEAEVKKALEVVDKKKEETEDTRAYKTLLTQLSKKLEAEKKAAADREAKLEQRLQAVEAERAAREKAEAEKAAAETRSKIGQIREAAKNAGLSAFDDSTEAVLESVWGQEAAKPLVAAFLQAIDKASQGGAGAPRTSGHQGSSLDSWRNAFSSPQASQRNLITVEHSRTEAPKAPAAQPKVETKPASNTPVNAAFPSYQRTTVEDIKKKMYAHETPESVAARAARYAQRYGDRFGTAQ